MKLSRRDQKILLYAGGALAVILIWVFVFQKAQERNMVMTQENMELQNQLNKLSTLAANEEQYKKEIKQMNKEMAEIYQSFPAEIKEETVIMYGYGLEENGDVHINNIKIEPKNLAFEAKACLYDTKVNYEFLVTYGGIKDTADYIFKDKEKRTMRSLALAYDKGSGNLIGSLNMDFWGLKGTDAAYEEPWVPSMPIGEDNIFGTIEQLEGGNP